MRLLSWALKTPVADAAIKLVVPPLLDALLGKADLHESYVPITHRRPGEDTTP